LIGQFILAFAACGIIKVSMCYGRETLRWKSLNLRLID